MNLRKPKNRPAVHISILAYIAYQNLLHKKLRTLLTVFGISIGIGAVYFLLSFGLGIQRLVTNEVIGNQSIRTIDVSVTNSKVIRLDDTAIERIKAVPDIDEIGNVYYFPGSFKLNNSESDSIVYGVDKGYENLTYLNLVKGKLLSDAKDKKNAVVINTATLESIGLSKNPEAILGKEIELIVPLDKVDKKIGTYTEKFEIVGVIDSGSGAEIFINSSIFRELGVPALTQLKVGAKDVEAVTKIRKQIESIGFGTSSPVDTLNDINKVFKFLNIILVGFGGIGMIIAVLGMFNTLTISLLERTKEIGLMVALGARSVDMKRLFIFEALFLSIFGAIIGIISALFLGLIVNLMMNMSASHRGVKDSFSLFSNPPLLIFSVIAFMAFVGLLVVILPARRAQKVNPIDALRRE